tara:strand:- start:127 stop:342 length:216 start_codon:yes stop_codon:yes gene_type:complete
MAREGTITQVTPEELERVRKNVAWLQSNMVDDLEIENKIASLRSMLDDVIRYLADRDGVSQADVCFNAIGR